MPGRGASSSRPAEPRPDRRPSDRPPSSRRPAPAATRVGSAPEDDRRSRASHSAERGGGGSPSGWSGARDRLAARLPTRRSSGRRRPGGWLRRIGAVLAVILLLVLGFGIYLDARMTRVDALADYEGRTTGGSGTNWLIVGSDSRAGLTTASEEALATGDADGNRTDTMMIVHIGGFGGQTSLISLPRDSLLQINGKSGKLNSAFSVGGPQLLVQTIEQASGIEIDHYAEIGFEGFASMVDAVGGVNICLDEAIDDPKAGIDLPAGCQDLSGPNALGFVRTRAFPNADLQRVQNQRKFLSALIGEAASPTTLLNPFAIVPFANSAVGTLTVDDSTHIWNLASLGLAMKSISGGSGVTTTVPIQLAGGGAVRWDPKKSKDFWAAVHDDDPIPDNLLSGTS